MTVPDSDRFKIASKQSNRPSVYSVTVTGRITVTHRKLTDPSLSLSRQIYCSLNKPLRRDTSVSVSVSSIAEVLLSLTIGSDILSPLIIHILIILFAGPSLTLLSVTRAMVVTIVKLHSKGHNHGFFVGNPNPYHHYGGMQPSLYWSRTRISDLILNYLVRLKSYYLLAYYSIYTPLHIPVTVTYKSSILFLCYLLTSRSSRTHKLLIAS